MKKKNLKSHSKNKKTFKEKSGQEQEKNLTKEEVSNVSGGAIWYKAKDYINKNK